MNEFFTIECLNATFIFNKRNIVSVQWDKELKKIHIRTMDNECFETENILNLESIANSFGLSIEAFRLRVVD